MLWALKQIREVFILVEFFVFKLQILLELQILFKATILQLGCQVQMKCFNNAIQILYIAPKTRTEIRYSLLKWN